MEPEGPGWQGVRAGKTNSAGRGSRGGCWENKQLRPICKMALQGLGHATRAFEHTGAGGSKGRDQQSGAEGAGDEENNDLTCLYPADRG